MVLSKNSEITLEEHMRLVQELEDRILQLEARAVKGLTSSKSIDELEEVYDKYLDSSTEPVKVEKCEKSLAFA